MLWLHILQQSEKQELKTAETVVLGGEGLSKEDTDILDSVHSLATGFCHGWDKSVECCGPVPQLHNRVSSPFLPHTFCLSVSQHLSSTAPAMKAPLHEPDWLGSPRTCTCGWRNSHLEMVGREWKHMCHKIATDKLRTPRGWWMCSSARGGITDHVMRGNGLLHADRKNRYSTHLLTQRTSAEFLNTCRETMVVLGWPSTSEEVYSRLGLSLLLQLCELCQRVSEWTAQIAFCY